MKTGTQLKRGVTLYSYQEEFYTRAMTLEDCLAEMAAIGAEGLELLIAPYVYNIHGKFYEMSEDMKEPNIPYEEIIPALIEAGCTGYINSEYEGQRLTQDAFQTDSCEQVRRHQLMMARLLGEGGGVERGVARAATRV
jgi:sugar phosphate isomerase/epimerase